MRYNHVLALPLAVALASFGVSGHAQTLDAAATAAQEQAFASATGCTKQHAEVIAVKAVGGGNVIQAVYEKQDHIPHWSVDIVGSTHEYEVWVNADCKVIRIITQPL